MSVRRDLAINRPLSNNVDGDTTLCVSYVAFQMQCLELSIQFPGEAGNILGLALKCVNALQLVARTMCPLQQEKEGKWCM